MLKAFYKEGIVEAGCDEAGRGPLAGSVYAAAVILPPDYQNEKLNDSKKLTEKQRYALREEIERDAIAWSLGIVTPKEIDEMNILRASITAMHRALDGLKVRPEHIIVDGNRFYPYYEPAEIQPEALPLNGGYREALSSEVRERNGQSPERVFIPYQTIVKGDGKYLSIAAASILAKTYRDDYMKELHKEYPMYGWDKNAGYPTKAHREAIKQYGTTPYHRMSFNLLGSAQLELNFGD